MFIFAIASPFQFDTGDSNELDMDIDIPVQTSEDGKKYPKLVPKMHLKTWMNTLFLSIVYSFGFYATWNCS